MKNMILTICVTILVLIENMVSSSVNAEGVSAASDQKKSDIGKIFQECPDCPEMVVIPSGSFVMGSPSTDASREGLPKKIFRQELPAHKVNISYSFALGKYDVTFKQWNACVADGGCKMHFVIDKKIWANDNQPAILVNYEDAQTYISWLNGKLRTLGIQVVGKEGPYRLPTEAEWEYAARAGTTGQRYWGNLIGKNHANCAACDDQWANKQTSPVGSFPPNQFGLFDMLGNVQQWVEDCWHPNYKGAPVDGSVWKTGDCSSRVVRGSSWGIFDYLPRVTSRSEAPAVGYQNDELGFRVARTLP